MLSYGDAQVTPLPQTDLYQGNVIGTRRANCFHTVGPDCVPADKLLPHPSQVTPVSNTPEVIVDMHLKFIHGPLFNGVRFAEPETPPIFGNGNVSALPGIWPCPGNATYDGCSAQFGCNCTQVIDLKYNQQVRLTLDNLWPTTKTGVTGVHPFHLHGHKFAVLGIGYNGPYSDAYSASLNLVIPSWRDNIIISAGGWTVLQFIADNPGTWVGHCHMNHHENVGMVMMFAEAMDRLAYIGPPANFSYCQHWDTASYEGTLASLPKFAPNSGGF